MDPARLLAHEAGLEEHLGATEALAAHGDDVAVGQLVRLLLVRALRGRLHFGVEIQGDVRQLLFHVADDLALRRGREGIPALRQDLHHVLRQVSPGEVQPQDRVRQGVALVDGHGVRHAIARVHDHARGAAGGVERQHGLDGHVHRRHVEGLEHDLGHALPVRLRVQRRLGEQHRVLLRRNSELVVERMMPDLLHVVPIRHDAVLNRVLQGQDASLTLRFIANIRVLLVHANHDAWHLRAAHDGGEHSARRVVAGKTALDHAAAIVAHDGRDLLVTHGCQLRQAARPLPGA
mmetsp:Transcript_94634/g.289492  ORF Transcript_94634/g.289492 Transcript_94634/m.289492 type:complete len:291 (-) Transcript_94634:9-881(-)